MSDTDSATKPPSKKRSRGWRWFTLIVRIIAIIVIVVGGGVQIVLWTSVPNDIVVGQLEKQLSLRIHVNSLSTSWLGHTVLHGVTIGLPLADKAFLDVPTMTVKNTSLFQLILSRDIQIQRVELDEPHLSIWQNEDGTWNVSEVAALLAGISGNGATTQPTEKPAAPQIPDFKLVRGTISIVDNKQHKLDLTSVDVAGYHDSAVSFRYELSVPPQAHVTGRIVTGGNWQHEVAIKIQDLAAWSKSLGVQLPNAVVEAKWAGQLNEGGVDGRLDLTHLAVLGPDGKPVVSVGGGLAATYGNKGLNIRPSNLTLKSGVKNAPEVKVTSGNITFIPATEEIQMDQILVTLLGGMAKASGQYNIGAGSGQIKANWEHLAIGSNATHAGSFSASLEKPYPDRIAFESRLTSSGASTDGNWNASVAMKLNGKSLSDFDWDIHGDQLTSIRNKVGIDLSGLHLVGSFRDQVAKIDSISLPKDDLIAGSVEYQLKGKHAWRAALQGRRWPFKPIPGTELAVNLDAEGDADRVHLKDFSIKSPDASMSLAGVYSFNEPKPVNFQLTVRNAVPAQAPEAYAANAQSKLVEGAVDGTLKLNGTVSPCNIELGGGITGKDLKLRGHRIGDLSLSLLQGSRFDDKGGQILTGGTPFFGGQLGLQALYNPSADLIQVDLGLHGISLADIARVAGQENVSGTLDGKLRVSAPWSNPTLAAINIPPATFVFKDIAAEGLNVDEIAATLTMDSGRVQLNPIALKRGAGHGDIRVAANLLDLRRIDASVDIAHWPIEGTGSTAQAEASAQLPEIIIDLPDSRSRDPQAKKLRVNAQKVEISAKSTLKGEPFARLDAHGAINARSLHLGSIHVNLLDGRADGHAQADIDAPLKSTAEFT